MKSWLPHILVLLFFVTPGCRWDDELRPDPSPWDYGDPASAGLNQNLLLDLDSVIKAGYLSDISSMLVLKEEKLVFENYYQFNTRDSLQAISSMGNVLVSILTGFAVEDGLIQSIDDSVFHYLDDYQSYFEADTLKKGIKFSHLLTMRSGISWNETLTSPFSPSNDLNVVRTRAIDRVAYLLSKPMESEAGQRYAQNSSASLIILKAIENRLQVPIEEYLHQRLFVPLDITSWKLDKDETGLANIAFGLKLKPLDLMKVGYLMMQQGKWKGKQLLAEDWLQQSTAIQHKISNFLDIGYLWWRFSADSDWAPYFPDNDAFYAASDDAQYLFICPSYSLVFLLTTPEGNTNNSNIGYFILSNYLLQSLQPNQDD